MAAPATVRTEWLPDLLAYAVHRQVEQYLQPMLDASQRIFPNARSIWVTLDPDPEIRDLSFITYNVRIPSMPGAEALSLQRLWTDELVRLRPYPVIDGFVLLIE